MVWYAAMAPPADWTLTFFSGIFLSSGCGCTNTGSLTGLFLNFWPFNDTLRPCLTCTLTPSLLRAVPRHSIFLFLQHERSNQERMSSKASPHPHPYSPPLFCEEQELPSSCPHPDHASDSSHHLLHLSSVSVLVSQPSKVLWEVWSQKRMLFPDSQAVITFSLLRKNVQRDNWREFHFGSVLEDLIHGLLASCFWVEHYMA